MNFDSPFGVPRRKMMALGAAAATSAPIGPRAIVLALHPSTHASMNLSAIDWAIVVAYFAALDGNRHRCSRRRVARASSEYFLSGRNVSWWLAGASMVATTFAADTPLVVTGLVVSTRRRRQLAVVEHADERNAHRVLLRAALAPRGRDDRRRVRRAALQRQARRRSCAVSAPLYLALPINLIILGWVTLAMIKILTISLGLHP